MSKKSKRDRGEESSPSKAPSGENRPPKKASSEENDQAEIDPAAEAPSEDDLPIKKKKRRFRRTRIALLILFAMAVVLRIVLAFSIEPLLDAVADRYGLSCQYDRLDLSLLGGDLELWHLVVLDPSEGESATELVHLEYCRADLSVLDLFRGRLVVRRVEADGVDLFVERRADGTIPWLERLSSQPPSEVEPNAKPEDSESSLAPESLDVPVRLDALRFQHVLVHLKDDFVDPPLETRLHANVRLSNLGHPVHSPRFSVEMSADRILESMIVEGKAETSSDRIVAEIEVDLHSLKLDPLRPYLAQAGFEPIAERWQGRFAGRADLRANTDEDDPRVRALFTASDLSFGASGGDRWELDHCSIDAELTRTEFLFHGGRVSGGRTLARRAPTGQVEVLGLRTIQPVRRSDPNFNADLAESVEPAPAATPPDSSPIIPGPILRGFENFVCENIEATIVDQATKPESTFVFALDRLKFDSTGEDTVAISGEFRAPGIAERGTLEGVAQLALPRSELELQVTTEGIDPAAAKAQLDSAQIESILKEGLLQFAVQAALEVESDRLTSHVSLRDFAFHDSQQWVGIDSMRLEGLEVDRATGGLHVEEITISSPRLELRRDREERLIALGMRWDPRPVRQAAKPAPTGLPEVSPGEPPAVSKVSAKQPSPPIHVDRIRWSDTRIRYSDDALPEAEPLEIADLGVEIDDLFIASDPKATDPRGKLRAWITLPGVAESIRLEGTLEPLPGGTQLTATLTGEGISGDRLGPYLAEFGFGESLEDGRLSGQLVARFSQEGASTQFGLQLERFEFKDREQVLVSCETLAAPAVRLEANSVEIQPVEVVKPHLRLTRLSDGNWQALGIRSLSQQLDPDKTAEVLDQPPPPAPKSVPVVQFGGVKLREGTLAFDDQLHSKVWQATANAELSDLTWSEALSESQWSLDASIDGTARAIEVDGELQLSRSQLELRAKLIAEGLQGELANTLLPPQVRVEWQDGTAQAEASFALRSVPEGGQHIDAALANVSWSEGDQRYFEMERAEAVVTRLDWAQRVVEIERVAVTGVAGRADRDAQGVVRVFGVALDPNATVEPNASVGKPPAQQTSTPSATAAAPTAPARRRALLETPPQITIDTVSFGLREWEWFDATMMVEPVRLSNSTLKNVEPWFALAPDRDENPPLRLRATGQVEPKLAKFESTVSIGIFSDPLFLESEARLYELDGSRFDQAFAPISQDISLRDLNGSELRGRLEASIQLTRSSPLEFDFSRPFTADAELSRIALTSPDETPWAGVDSIRLSGVRVALPRRVTVRDLEIERPHGRIERTEEGLSAFGLFLPEPPEGAPSPEPTPSDENAIPAVASTGSADSSSADAFEFELKRAMVSGLDLRVSDHSTEYPAVLPFDGFELTIENVKHPIGPSAEGPAPKPIRFSLFLEAGEALAPGATEETPVLGALTVDGELAIGSPLQGWVRTSIEAFDLAHLRGPAERQGVTLREGVFDFASTLHFRPSGQLDADSKIAFLDLSLSEGPNGPIRRFLQLPTPVDVAIFVVRDAGGAIRLPVGFELDPENISALEITKAAGYALGVLISKAIADSPFRVGGTVTDLVGLTGEEELKDPEPPVDLNFAGGELLPNRTTQDQLAALAKRVKLEPELRLVLEHELGPEDLEVARRRANPPVELSQQLLTQLERRRTTLRSSREAQAQVAASSLLAGVWQEAEQAREVLQATDSELGLIESSLDQLYELLAPGSEHRARQRLREAALAMARARLHSVREQFLQAGLAADRIRVRSPRFEKPDAEGSTEPVSGRVRVTPFR